MYSYDRSKTARADTQAVREFNDAISHVGKALRDSVSRIIRIEEPVQRYETYEVLRDMLTQEIRDYQTELDEVEKEMKLLRSRGV
jgi:hypothetical protein